MTKKLTALLLLLATFSFSHAETIVVTSNADNGPGTLREAIEKAAANGIGETDYIYFGLPDGTEMQRTIIIQSELPPLTSNLVIDGTTQPSPKLGLSDAKVIVRAVYSTDTRQFIFKLFRCNSIKIYGLKIDNKIEFTAMYPDEYCFDIIDCEAIEIGNVDKGNVIINWEHAIAIHSYGSPYKNKDINIYSNFVGINEDGKTPEYNYESIVIGNIENLNIGNLNPLQGNIMACMGYRIQISGTAGKILIANNKIGTDYTGTVALSLPFGEASHLYDNIAVENSIYIGERNTVTDVFIINNLTTGMCRAGIHLAGLERKFIIQGNKIGTDITGKKAFPEHFTNYGIWINSCVGGLIGVDADEENERNIIAYTKEGYSVSLAGTGLKNDNAEGITISRNSFFCNQSFSIINDENGPNRFPHIAIHKIENDNYYGTSDPNSKIEMFEDDDCVNCEGKTYIGYTFSDNQGYWSYKVPDKNKSYVGTATDPSGETSEFSASVYKLRNFKITGASCGRKNGTISGVQVQSGTRWHWEDEAGNVAGQDTVLRNVGAGKYRLLIGIGSNSCDVATAFFEVRNTDLIKTMQAPAMGHASCGQSSGFIKLKDDISRFESKWINTDGDSIGTGASITNLAPGAYRVKIWLSADPTCNAVFGPFSVKNLSGPSLNTGAVEIINASCGGTNGSITQIKTENVSGTPFLQWKDESGTVVGNTLDLVNVPGGKYRLQFKDGSRCDTITTAYFTVGGSSKTTIDVSNVSITPSQCRYGSGSIKNITVTGATDYEWTAENGEVVSREKAPTGLLPGIYKLTAGRETGCPKTSAALTLPVDPDMIVSPPLQKNITPATCGQPNGAVQLQHLPTPAQYTFNWMQSGTTAGAATTLDLKNVAPGTYTLFATDAKGCTQRVITAEVPALLPPVLKTQTVILQNDICSQQKGSIRNLTVQGGTAPFTYKWSNSLQQAVAATATLQKMPAGNYRLEVMDAAGCKTTSPWFTLSNETKTFAPPRYPGQVIPRNTSTTLIPQTNEQGTYAWFDDAALTQRLGENNTGTFVTASLPNDKTFYIRIGEGSCASAATAVTVKVADDAKVFVPTAFTPNKDGRNDDIKPVVTGLFTLEYFAIYDRWGNIVFKTSDPAKGWNGFNKGLEAPIGVYVWLLKGKDFKGNIIQQKGSFTLIR